MSEKEQQTNDDYNASSIVVLEGLEAVRKRPGMYIGDVQDPNKSGLHHMAAEILDNSVDEALAGHANFISVTIHEDESVTITDNGRGVPTAIHPKFGVSATELAFTKLHAGGKFDSKSYGASGGLHGVGAAVVNALSEFMRVEVTREGYIHTIAFSRGDITEGFKRGAPTKGHGTSVTFKADSRIFSDIDLDGNYIGRLLRERSFLTPKIKYVFLDEREEGAQPQTFYSEHGISELVSLHDANRKVVGRPVMFEGESEITLKDPEGNLTQTSAYISLAFEWTEDYGASRIYCYTNNIINPDGGTHLTGMKMAFNNVLKSYMQNNPNAVKRKKNTEIQSDDIFEGLTAVLSIRFPQPDFSSQTKVKLVSNEAQKATYAVINRELTEWLDRHPNDAKRIIQRTINAAEARLAARDAQNRIRAESKKNTLDISFMPGKLTHCSSKNPEECELFIVEGDSAGGTAKQGRDKRTQAILALKGKILNVHGAKTARILGSTEIGNIINALNIGGINASCNLDKLRYHRIILMTDADDDGSHIQALAITLFHDCIPEIIRRGYLYIAQSPLYALHFSGAKRKPRFVLDDNAYDAYLESRVLDSGYRLTWEDADGVAHTADKDATGRYLEALRYFSGGFERVIKRFSPDTADVLDVMMSNGFCFPESHGADVINDVFGECLNGLNTETNGKWNGSLDYKDGVFSGVTLSSRIRGVNRNMTIGLETILDDQFVAMLSGPHAVALDYIMSRGRLEGVDEEGNALPIIPLNGIRSAYEAIKARGSIGIKETQRFKGLGEMNEEQLWDTTMDPERRTLVRVTMEDAEKAAETIECFMGGKPQSRRAAFEAQFGGYGLSGDNDDESDTENSSDDDSNDVAEEAA